MRGTRGVEDAVGVGGAEVCGVVIEGSGGCSWESGGKGSGGQRGC